MHSPPWIKPLFSIRRNVHPRRYSHLRQYKRMPRRSGPSGKCPTVPHQLYVFAGRADRIVWFENLWHPMATGILQVGLQRAQRPRVSKQMGTNTGSNRCAYQPHTTARPWWSVLFGGAGWMRWITFDGATTCQTKVSCLWACARGLWHHIRWQNNFHQCIDLRYQLFAT